MNDFKDIGTDISLDTLTEKLSKIEGISSSLKNLILSNLLEIKNSSSNEFTLVYNGEIGYKPEGCSIMHLTGQSLVDNFIRVENFREEGRMPSFYTLRISNIYSNECFQWTFKRSA